ncbi:MAG: antibiotic biosynthesis monooxygenase [Myxococcales bacterium]|nr:antibiotic biosynthesis monooxygenase [Myxococcales bacterium]
MLIVSVAFEFVPGGFERIRNAVTDAVQNSREEAGAQIYDWAIDVTAPNRAIIFEVWDDQAALDRHFTHPYMDRLVAALSEASVRGDITRYSAEIYDVSGKRDMGFTLPTA